MSTATQTTKIQTTRKNGGTQNGKKTKTSIANAKKVSEKSSLNNTVSQNGQNGASSSYPPFPKTKFAVLYADPPWDYKGQLQHNGAGGKDTGGAIRHYPTVTTSEMSDWPIHKICEDDSLLFMWATSPHLDQAIDLGKAWGFNWATVAFVWDKERKNPGFYTLSMCELCLVFKRGKIPQPRGARNIEQLIRWKRTEHSTKPPEIKTRIDQMFPGHKKIELFARKKTKGWTSWGLEI